MFPQVDTIPDGVDRRLASATSSTVRPDPLAFRGLLHDVEHGLATLSSLLEVVHGDSDLSADSVVQVERAQRELGMLFGFIEHWSGQAAGVVSTPTLASPSVSPSAQPTVQPTVSPILAPAGLSTGLSATAVSVSTTAPVTAPAMRVADVRALAHEVSELAAIEHGVPVELCPGPEISLPVSAQLLWRVLANMVDNAARAAGPTGRVEVAVKRQDAIVIEVTDNGPGFGRGTGPGAGHADGDAGSLGLSVITSLLRSVGGQFEVCAGTPGRTTVRALFHRGGSPDGGIEGARP